MGVSALVLLVLVWFVLNGPVEGQVLFVVTPSRGLTTADIAGLAGAGVAAERAGWLTRGWLRERRAERS